MQKFSAQPPACGAFGPGRGSCVLCSAWSLEFSDRHTSERTWKSVVRRDATGKELERWQLVALQKPEDAGYAPIVDLTRPEPVYLVIGGPDENDILRRAFKSLRVGNWKESAELLRTALREHKQHPALMHLLVACHEAGREDSGVTRNEAIMALRQIAARASVELLGLTGRTRFSFVTAEEYFEIRSLQPESQRKPGDCLELAQLALCVNKPENALTLLDRSSARDVLLRIQALQALDRVDDARRLAEEFANNPMVRLDRIITTGDTLVRLGHRSVAETIFSALCERTDLSKTDRAAILLRHAAMMEDEPRWLRLLEAAGRLADRFRQNDVRLSLLQHQIDLLLMENEDPNIRRQQQVAGEAARIIARNGRELHAAGRLRSAACHAGREQCR